MSTLALNKHTPVDATAGAVSMILPGGAASGTEVSVEKYDSSVNAVTITGSIRGVSAQTITLALSKETIVFRADSSGSWWPLAGHKTLTSLDARFASQADSRLRKIGYDLREFGSGVGVGNATADTAALSAAWTSLLSNDTNGVVQSSPSDQYDTSQSTLILPPGRIFYNGTGLNASGMTNFVGRFAIRGSHHGNSEIQLSSGGRLIDVAGNALTRFELTDFQVRGGAGLFRHQRTANNIFGDLTFRRLVMIQYTGCAIEWNSQNMPYVTVEGCTFRGLDTLNTMGIALAGIANGAQIRHNHFMLNRVHLKTRQGGNDVYLDGNDFLRFSTDRTNGPVTDVWLVPDNTAALTATNGAGTGTHISKANKLGNENLVSGDYRVLIADEDTGTGTGNGSYWPNLSAASTGNIEGVKIEPQVYGSSAAVRSPVYSTTPNLWGCEIDINHRGGTSLPDYVLEFSSAALAAAGTDAYRRSNRITLVGRSIGIDKVVRASNLKGAATLVDPGYQISPLAEGGAASPDYAAIFPGTTGLAGWTSGGGSSKVGISDAYGLGEGNAVEVTMVAGGTLTGTLSSGAMTAGHRHFVEFVLRPPSQDPMPKIGFRVLDPSSNVVLQQILEIPTDARPYLVRIPFVPAVVGGSAQFYVVDSANDLPGAGPSGRFRAEWMVGYQGREPINVQPRRTNLSLLAGVKVQETGTAARMGVATLVSGTVTVNTTAVTNNSRIFLTIEGGVSGARGIPAVLSRVAGTSFTITSQDLSGTTVTNDTRPIVWLLVEPTS